MKDGPEVDTAKPRPASDQESRPAVLDQPTGFPIDLAFVAGLSFCLYWFSALILSANSATELFGADSGYYGMLADGQIVDRVARFHPLTVVLALAWLKGLAFLTPWITPYSLLTALFAAVGAIGVGAALSAFAMTVARRYVIVCGVIYAASLGIWYFSSLTESKIVTATLATLYISFYLRLRDNRSWKRVILLTIVLFAACMNEIVSGLLLIIPACDTFLQQGLRGPAYKWLAGQFAIVLLAFILLEFVVNGGAIATTTNEEGRSLFGMFHYYLTRNTYNFETLYWFILNWFFFSIAAPTTQAHASVPASPGYHGFFEPSLLNYLLSPGTACVAFLFGVIIVTGIVRSSRDRHFGLSSSLFWSLLAYAACRGVFFFVFNPYESILFSPAVTLVHLMVVLLPFTLSRFRWKGAVLGSLALLMLLVNGSFVLFASPT